MNDSAASPLAVLEVPKCCTVDSAPPGVRFHCALNVSDLVKSVEFYRLLLGMRPTTQEPDYAKFELVRPPLVLSLIPHAPGTGRGLRYLGFPVQHPDEVEALGVRLQTAGLSVHWHRDVPFDDSREFAVEITDPDGNHWRIGCRLNDAPIVADISTTARPTATASLQIGWEHRILLPIPEQIPHEAESVDFVRLEGTFNAEATAAQRAALLTEVRRVLKPGGVVHVHGLVANRVLPKCPVLHGVAALVRRVPDVTGPLEELRTAGLIDVQMTMYPSKAVFRWDDVELRELKLSASRQSLTIGAERTVMYRGPFARIVTDTGQAFPRGVPIIVDAALTERLKRPPWSAQFLMLDEREPRAVEGCASRKEST